MALADRGLGRAPADRSRAMLRSSRSPPGARCGEGFAALGGLAVLMALAQAADHPRQRPCHHRRPSGATGASTTAASAALGLDRLPGREHRRRATSSPCRTGRGDLGPCPGSRHRDLATPGPWCRTGGGVSARSAEAGGRHGSRCRQPSGSSCSPPPAPRRATRRSTPSAASIGGPRLFRRGHRLSLGDRRRRRDRSCSPSSAAASAAARPASGSSLAGGGRGGPALRRCSRPIPALPRPSPLQALHGLTFGATHLGAMAALAALAPEAARGRAQGLLGSPARSRWRRRRLRAASSTARPAPRRLRRHGAARRGRARPDARALAAHAGAQPHRAGEGG